MQKPYPLLVLAAFLFPGCVAIGVYDEDAIDKCGGKEYTSANQKCENGAFKTQCGTGNNYYNPSKQFCYGNNVIDKCGGVNYEPATYGCCGNTVFSLATRKCENNIVFSKCGDEWYNPALKYCLDNVIKDKGDWENEENFIDSRDGKIYRQVTIGHQTWMAENLRYETSNTKCYDDEHYNCEIFGILYDWNSAKTICPDGWHLPSDAEWIALANFVENESGCSGCAGTKLKADSDLWISGKGTDDWGFTALPGGCNRDNIFRFKGEAAGFWSATTGSSSGSAHFRYFNTREPLGLDGYYINRSWANVRCLRD